MVIRLIFLLLVFSNLVVWLLDPFAPSAAGREPQRMAQQILPEKLRIVREEPAANGAAAEPSPATATTPGPAAKATNPDVVANPAAAR